MSARTRRQYVPAYRADNGNVIPCGTETVIEEHARTDTRSLNEIWQDTVGSPQVFLAYRDLPEWLPVGGGVDDQ